VAAVAGLLAAGSAREAGAQFTATLAAGEMPGRALQLADHSSRVFWWRSLLGPGFKAALATVLVAAVFWTWRDSRAPRPAAAQTLHQRIEALGQAWGRVVLQFDVLKQHLATMNPNDPAAQAQADALGQESARIKDQFAPLLVPAEERDDLTEFLTAEITTTMNLDAREKTAVSNIVRRHLGQGATFKDAMSATAAETPVIAAQVKAVLSPAQQQRFDEIYSPDASGFLAYLKAAIGTQPGQPTPPRP